MYHIRYITNASTAKGLQAAFYQNPDGHEPVRAWIKRLPPEDRKIIGKDIATVEYGWPVGMPLCRALSGGLWEVRSNLSGGRIARMLFCTVRGSMVLLHGFVKKTQKTPLKELDLARQRKKGMEL